MIQTDGTPTVAHRPRYTPPATITHLSTRVIEVRSIPGTNMRLRIYADGRYDAIGDLAISPAFDTRAEAIEWARNGGRL